MYKRKARVLFLSQANDCRGLLAERLAGHLGGEWLEARSAGLAMHPPDPRVAGALAGFGLDAPPPGGRAVTAEDLTWADLVVSLDEPARAVPLPAGTRGKHWPLPAAPALGGLDALREEIARRITAMVGGMRMLARMDADEAP